MFTINNIINIDNLQIPRDLNNLFLNINIYKFFFIPMK